jgi:hypothetical protein
MPLLDKTRRRRKRRSINLFGLRGRKRNSRAYTLKRRRGERMSHFKKATSFAREARGPIPIQTAQRDNGAIENNYVQPVEFDDPGKWRTMARQDGRRGEYAQSLISQHMEETRRASRAQNKGAKPP